MIKTLIFDMDGLMIDSERLYISSEEEIAKEFGRELTKETIWRMMGKTPEESIRVFKEDLKINLPEEEILKKRDQMMIQKLKTDLVTMPGLHEIIASFSNILNLAIATGAPGHYLDIVVNKLELKNLFKVLVCADDIKKGKPHPEIYLKTCQRIPCLPEEAVVLEDSLNGSQAAKKAGCYTIAVPSEYTIDQDFSFTDYIAKDLFSAGDHIKNLL